MKLQKLIGTLLVLVLILSGCSDVLDMAPEGNLEMDEVLADPDKVEALLNKCYGAIPQKGYSYWFYESLLVAASDDGYSSDEAADVPVTGVYQDNNSASFHQIRDAHNGHSGDNFRYWDLGWRQIRLCNQFLELIDQAVVYNDTDRGKDRFKAEARVLRAFYYMELIKWFGKVPIMDETVPYYQDFSYLSRSSVYDLAQFIIADCDYALQEPNFPWRITSEAERMRMTKAIACALKTKAILFAASPLHNEGQNHWEEAYTVAKDAVTRLKANGYELFTQNTRPTVFGDGPASALRQLVTTAADFSSTPRDRETILQVRGGGVFLWNIGYIGSNMTNTYKCATAPTQELVDAFETIDGKPILNLERPYLDEKHLQPNYNISNTLYDQNDPYKNRDPRLYETVIHNGSMIYYNIPVTVEVYVGGAHQPSWDVTNRVSTRTGYYQQKLVTPYASNNNRINNSPFKYYRLGETLLDLAEAAAEAGHLEEARVAANEVRARSGMPNLPTDLSQKELILRIRNERRVELAWEEQRYFDLRRWQKPDGDLSETCKWLTGMRITKESDGKFTYTRVNCSNNPRGGHGNRDLLLPLPLKEASLLEKITGQKWQNPGW